MIIIIYKTKLLLQICFPNHIDKGGVRGTVGSLIEGDGQGGGVILAEKVLRGEVIDEVGVGVDEVGGAVKDEFASMDGIFIFIVIVIVIGVGL